MAQEVCSYDLESYYAFPLLNKYQEYKLNLQVDDFVAE
jgi:hypothetical protein